MPFADTTLRDEYAAAVERVAGRVLDALRGAGDPAAPTRPSAPGATRLTARPTPSTPPTSPTSPTSPTPSTPSVPSVPSVPEGPLLDEGPLSKAVLAAVRVLGPDLFAAPLLAGLPLDGPTADAAAEALETFPMTGASPAPGTTSPQPPAPPETALANAWRDRATARLVELAGRPAPATGPEPVCPPEPTAADWPRWSVAMARLSALALPRLDGPVHDLARLHSLTLSRGVTRSMLRRDYRTAARLARWLAWNESVGGAAHLELGPVLDRIRAVGDGSTRMWLELSITERLPGTGVTTTGTPADPDRPDDRPAPPHGRSGDSPDGAAA
ncbi:hypothetical protein GCM10009639_21540 [Kitasatospora putterlickiae]|uniref:Uncharacterized protein n=1 Tax=Kitasatospora putterlickiae TaxID=221725 RepID=A0ABN1XVV3_9ACTN